MRFGFYVSARREHCGGGMRHGPARSTSKTERLTAAKLRTEKLS
jgi:hypothetical protein